MIQFSLIEGISMSRTTTNIGFTVPPGMAEEFDRLAREEQSTKSELFRHMFLLYQSYRKQAEQSEKKQFDRLLQPSPQNGGGIDESGVPENLAGKESRFS